MSRDARTLVERHALPPDEIEALSIRRLEAAAGGLDRWTTDERVVALRMMWAAGDAGIAERIRIHPEAIERGLATLRAGCAVCVDVRMVEIALDRGSLARLDCAVHCRIDAPAVVAEAKASGLPRAVMAMRALAAQVDGGIAVIGTAPTALLALLDMLDAGTVHPALVIGTPVGFVAAAEAKAELMDRAVPFITIEGTRGGAAMASAATNALLQLAIAPTRRET